MLVEAGQLHIGTSLVGIVAVLEKHGKYQQADTDQKIHPFVAFFRHGEAVGIAESGSPFNWQEETVGDQAIDV